MCKGGELDEYCKGHAATEIKNQSINETVRQVEPSFYRAERIHAFRGLSPALSVCLHLSVLIFLLLLLPALQITLVEHGGCMQFLATGDEVVTL